MWATLPIHSATTHLPPPRHFSAVHNHNHHSKQLNTLCLASLGQEQEPDDNKQLSGADILVALQKANAKKAMKKKEKLVTRIGNGKRSKKDQDGIASLASVKPLCIKQQWSERLVDLETRLEEFMHG